MAETTVPEDNVRCTSNIFPSIHGFHPMGPWGDIVGLLAVFHYCNEVPLGQSQEGKVKKKLNVYMCIHM